MSATCCPVGYNFIDSAGGFNDPAFGYGTIANSNVSDFAGKCATLVNIGSGASPISAWALLPLLPTEPIECPCCAVGYSYSDSLALCVSNTDRKSFGETIPCIYCVCPPAPEPVDCPACESAGTHISFSFNFNQRNCASCVVQDGNVPPGGITSFIPTTFADPITSNFKLKNKNFI
jgi:hypothetical protein